MMPKIAKELKALAVKRITRRGFNNVGTVPGLGLRVGVNGRRAWVLRVMVGGKRREMGLGGYPGVSLEGAIEKARTERDAIREGVDPIVRNAAARSALKASKAAAKTFKECAVAYIAAHEAEWRNAKHGQQWRNTLDTYAYPVLGDVLVQDVTAQLVADVLRPIWHEKTETAVRLKGRIERVLDYATAHHYRTGENPARWRGNLKEMLADPTKIAPTTNHKALHYADVGAFMQRLRLVTGVSARCLEFTILTAARSGETRGATWGEFDLDHAEWTVPAERMKGGKTHHVPLSDAAVRLLQQIGPGEADASVFPSPRTGRPLSDMALTELVRGMKVNAVPHGFRATFKTWAEDSPDNHYEKDAIEFCLAHKLPDSTESSYMRSTKFLKRRIIMRDWAGYCAIVQPDKGNGTENVVSITATVRSSAN